MADELETGRKIFRTLRLAGCGFTLSDSGRISTTGETPDPEMLAEANTHVSALGNAIAEVTALENLLRRRLREGSAGTSIARAILDRDPCNDFAIMALRDAPDSAAAIYDCLQGMGLTVARSTEDAEKVNVTGPQTVLASACGAPMRQAIAQHRTALLQRIDQAAVQATATSTKSKMTARTIRKNPASAMHAIQIFHVALGDRRFGLRQTATGQIEVYGPDPEVVSRFAHDAREGLGDEQHAILSRLISDYPIEPRSTHNA